MKKKKIKLQVKKHLNNPKWIPPELRMDRYEDYGLGDIIPLNDDPVWKKMKWIDFCIVVKDEDTKKQLEAACEYLHDNPTIDTEFLAINALVHAYENFTNTNGHQFDPIVVDPIAFKYARQRTCIHKETIVDGGIRYCKFCDKAMEIVNYRD